MPRSFPAGETFSFAIDFHGVPATAAGLAGGAPLPPQTNHTSHTVLLTQKSQTFSLPGDVEPMNVELDPDAWVFMRATFTRRATSGP